VFRYDSISFNKVSLLFISGNIIFAGMKLDTFKFLVEYNAFGVCTRAGERLGMPIKNIRLFFIYASCLTIGSPLIIYMILAFWLKLKDYVRGSRNPVWDY